jgi:uncharacterized membrane protein YadS
MNDRWLTVLKKIRRVVWLVALVVVLALLLIYKVTENEASLMWTFASVLVAVFVLGTLTAVSDQIEAAQE